MNGEARRKLLRRIPSGLYVIGVRRDAELHAFTASWLMQTSITPPAVVLGVRRRSRVLALLTPGSHLSVNFVGKDDRALVQHFFTRGCDDRLAGIPVRVGRTGAPILEQAIGYLECEVRAVVDEFGDHAPIIAEVVEAGLVRDVEPLIMNDTPWHYGA